MFIAGSICKCLLAAAIVWVVAAIPVCAEAQADPSFHPFNFAVLSDLHLTEPHGIDRLNRALEMIADRHDIAFVLVLGDIVWDKDPAALKTLLAKAAVPVHLVYGNNDWKWVSDGSYEKAFGPRDFSFTYAHCTFIEMWDCLPREHLENHRGEITEPQWAWLERQLQTARGEGSVHTFISMHVPPAAPGAYNNLFFMFTRTQDRLLGLMDQYHVTAGLFGHLHQQAHWTHGETQLYVNPSCCWNFVSRTRKVSSGFIRIMKVDRQQISDELLPVHLQGETFNWDNLANFYDPAQAPK